MVLYFVVVALQRSNQSEARPPLLSRELVFVWYLLSLGTFASHNEKDAALPIDIDACSIRTC